MVIQEINYQNSVNIINKNRWSMWSAKSFNNNNLNKYFNNKYIKTIKVNLLQMKN